MPVAVLAASGLALVGLRVQQRMDAERVGQDYAMKVRLRLFRRITALPAGARHSERYGLTLTRLVTDLGSLRAWVSRGYAQAVVASVALPGTLAAMAWVGRDALLVGTLTVALCLGIGAALLGRLRSEVRSVRQRRGRLAANLGEKVAAAMSVRHFGRSEQESKRVRRHSARMRDAAVARARTIAVLRALPDGLQPAGVGAVLVLGALHTDGAGALSHSDLLVAIVLLGLLARALRDLARAATQRVNFEEGRRRIESLLESERVREARRPVVLPDRDSLALTVRALRAGGVLEGVDLDASAGERVRLCGPSGSGKSLLLALIARLSDPDEGWIEIGGVPLRRVEFASLHRRVQLVSPDLPLLRGSVGENIAYGSPDDAAAARAARICELDAPARGLPEGLETRVEEAARNLPAGVCARVALARALAMAPAVLLVDDPAFASDARAQRALGRACRESAFTLVWATGAGDLPVSFDRAWKLDEHGEPARRPLRAADAVA